MCRPPVLSHVENWLPQVRECGGCTKWDMQFLCHYAVLCSVCKGIPVVDMHLGEDLAQVLGLALGG